jgi:hypothetical protein
MTEVNPLPVKKKKKVTNPAPNFAGILEEATRKKERKVPPLPPGTYLCIVENYLFEKFGEDDTPCIDFLLKPLEAIDVDFERLYEIGIELSDVEIRHRIFVTAFGSQYCSQESLRKLVKFLDQDLEVSASILSEAIANAVGKRVIVKVIHKASSDGTRMFLAVKKTAKPNEGTRSLGLASPSPRFQRG